MQTTIHDKAEIWAAPAATGGLNETELKAWSDHIVVCPECKKLYNEEIAMGMFIKKILQPESPDPGFERRMIFKFRQAHVKNKSRWHQSFRLPLILAGTAGGLALIAFAMTGWLMKEKPSPVVSVTLASNLKLPPPAVQNPIPQAVQPQPAEKNDEMALSLPPAVQNPVPEAIQPQPVEKNDETAMSPPPALQNPIPESIQSQPVEKSDETALTGLPAAVRIAITAAVGRGKLEGIDKTSDGGEIAYEVAMTAPDGRENNLTFAPDGTLTCVEMDMADLPASIQSAITAAVGRGKLEGIGKTFDDGEIAYEATVSTPDGREHNLIFAQDGTLTCVEMALADLPAPVQNAITAAAGRGKLGWIDKTFDDGKITYEATVTTPDGREHGLTFSPGGKLLSREVTLNETPIAVRKTISKALGGGKLVEIDQSFVAVDRVMPYEVEAQKNSKPFDFMVSPKGEFLGMEN